MSGNGKIETVKNLLTAKGEMTMRMRAYDWSKMLWAKVETRLQSWKAVVRIAKAFSQPTYIGWSREVINYNNTYRSVRSSRVSNISAKSCCVRGVTFHCSLPELKQEVD